MGDNAFSELTDRLAEDIRRFNLGRRIAGDMLHDRFDPANARYTPQIHDTRVDGMNPSTDQLEAVGFLAELGVYTLRHPIRMYRVFSEK